MRLRSVAQRHLQRCCCLVLLALPWLTMVSAFQFPTNLKERPAISRAPHRQIHGNTVRRPSFRILQDNTSAWHTLDGSPPLVIARGGSSGIFPDQTLIAYALAVDSSLPSTTALMCDLQLTKDAVGICRTGIDLGLSTDVSNLFPTLEKTYNVNGVQTQGFFSIDLTATQALINLTAVQTNQARPPGYNGIFVIARPEDVAHYANFTRHVWINVEYPSFFSQHNLEMSSSVLALMAQSQVDYISSPEIAFLKAIKTGAPNTTAKLVLKFGAKQALEPSTNVTYASLLADLNTTATYASGIIVPKEYIWPVDNATSFLGAESTLIRDAHVAGLAIYASGFINDPVSPIYNYSFDPVSEYLQYVPSTGLNVDGFITEFPDTASEAIACFRSPPPARAAGAMPLVISHNGDSGNFPGCTLKSYASAVRGGASYIDCPVQMTSDGVLICRESPDLLPNTDAGTHSNLLTRASTISQLQPLGKGLFSFNLTWAEIQTLKARMFSPQANYPRSSAYTTESIISLAEFLKYANSTTAGILIDIQNGYFLETEIGLDVVGSVLASLNDAGLSTSNRVVIQSEDSAVLQRFKQLTNYTLVFRVTASDIIVTQTEVAEVKALTNFVTLPRGLIQVTNSGFLMNKTDVVDQFHAQNVSVFVFVLRNEFVTLPFDYESNPILQLNTFIQEYEVDGLITDFPATATAYLGNTCLNVSAQATAALPYSIRIVEPGDLLTQLPPAGLSAPPPASTEHLNVSDGELALPPSLSPRQSPTAPPSKTPAKSPAPSPSAAFSWSEPTAFVFLLAAALSIVLSQLQ